MFFARLAGRRCCRRGGQHLDRRSWTAGTSTEDGWLVLVADGWPRWDLQICNVHQIVIACGVTVTRGGCDLLRRREGDERGRQHRLETTQACAPRVAFQRLRPSQEGARWLGKCMPCSLASTPVAELLAVRRARHPPGRRSCWQACDSAAPSLPHSSRSAGHRHHPTMPPRVCRGLEARRSRQRQRCRRQPWWALAQLSMSCCTCEYPQQSAQVALCGRLSRSSDGVNEMNPRSYLLFPLSSFLSQLALHRGARQMSRRAFT